MNSAFYEIVTSSLEWLPRPKGVIYVQFRNLIMSPFVQGGPTCFIRRDAALFGGPTARELFVKIPSLAFLPLVATCGEGARLIAFGSSFLSVFVSFFSETFLWRKDATVDLPFFGKKLLESIIDMRFSLVLIGALVFFFAAPCFPVLRPAFDCVFLCCFATSAGFLLSTDILCSEAKKITRKVQKGSG